MRIAIIDYGAGNLRSVERALVHLGFPPVVTSDPEVVAGAEAVILPGVGAAADTMDGLRAHGMVDAVQRAIAEEKPFLGVCVGFQVLLSGSEEGGWQECVGAIPGRVRRIEGDLKVPHMGWNRVSFRRDHPLFAGIPDRSYFYFVHSYVCQPEDAAVIAGETDYGGAFCSVAARGKLAATQFHPEKSGALGLRIYDNFCRRVAGFAPVDQSPLPLGEG
jgi:glutamine amidotransferase